jgi:ketosteroid isomerase-like protein
MRQRAVTVQLLLLVSAGLVSFVGKTVSRTNGQSMNSQPDPRLDGMTHTVVDHFNDAFNRHDPDALEALLTDNTVFENTSPPPDGQRIVGKAAVMKFWREWFARNPDARFEAEEIIVSGDRAVVRWIYRKTRNGQPWHLRGVDVFVVRDGKVAAKFAYVKG